MEIVRTAESVTDCDVHDMLSSGLYTRDWRLVGRGGDSNATVQTDFLFMVYIETDETSGMSTATERPIVVSGADTFSIEIIPAHPQVLGRFFEYVARTTLAGVAGEKLVSICQRGLKSPCFDIPDCYIAVPTSKATVPKFCSVNITGDTMMLFIPTTVVYSIIDALGEIGIVVLPSWHDCCFANSSRLGISRELVSCDLTRKTWDRGVSCAEISRLIPSIAVTTATLTVIPRIDPDSRAKWSHTSRRILTFIVHAIK